MNKKRLFLLSTLGLFIFTLLLSFLIQQKKISINSKAQSSSIFNNEVYDLLENKITDINQKNLILKKRYDNLIELMKNDREKFFNSLLSEEEVRDLETYTSKNQRPLYEEYVNVEGKLVELVADYIDGSSKVEYGIMIDEQYFELIAPENKFPQGSSNAQIHVKGIKLGNYITPFSSSKNLEIIYLPTFKTINLVPEKETIYILNITFSNQASSPFTNDELQEKVFGEKNSVKEFYLKDSYGKSNLSGKVYNFNIINNTYNCNFWQLGEQADSRLRSALGNINISGTKRVYVFSKTPCFGWAGLATINGNQVWNAGYNEVSLYAHELGHNYGLLHANSLGCENKQIDSLNKCKEIEYGNIYDALGHSWYGNYHSQSYYKFRYGWLNNNDIPTITKTGIYKISNIEAINPTLPRAIKILRNNYSSDYLYTEYRSQGQFERSDPVRPLSTETNFGKGLSINLISENYNRQSRLIDNTPQTFDDSAITNIFDDDFVDSSLMLNNSFYDEIDGIGVTLISKTENDADILVTFYNETIPPENKYRDYVYPLPPKPSVTMNRQNNTLLFKWEWVRDRTCPYHCVDPVGYCTAEGQLSSHVFDGIDNRFGNTCDPSVGPFTWDITIKGETEPRFFLKSNGNKNVTQTPQSTEFVFPCDLVTSRDIYNRAVYMRIWTTDGAGNKTSHPLVFRGVCS